MYHIVTLIIVFPLILSGLYTLAHYIECRRARDRLCTKIFMFKWVGIYFFGMFCILPSALRVDQNNLSLFWQGSDRAFLNEYLSDNFSNFLMGFPILLMLFYVLEVCFPGFKIQRKRPHAKHLVREFLLCMSSMLCFAPAVFLIAYFSNYGWYHMYYPWDLYGRSYFVGSILIFLIAHELYFYSLHRFMHYNRWLYRHVHHVHHLSHNPTVFSTYALHPIEALLEPLPYVLMPFLVPISYEGLVAALLIAEFFNIMGHHGCEWFPAWFAKAPILKYLNRATFHNMHHSHGGRSNFGYYSTVLDRWLGTLHKDSEAYFDRIVARRAS